MQQNNSTHLQNYQSNNFEIKKHSSLTQMKSDFSLQQRKSINALIRIAKDQLKRNKDETVFQIDLMVVKKLA